MGVFCFRQGERGFGEVGFEMRECFVVGGFWLGVGVWDAPVYAGDFGDGGMV